MNSELPISLSRRGTSQTGVRLYHERLILSLVRSHGALPKAEITRLTGLSAQTISVIVRELEKDGLLTKGEAVRGKVGQPSQPLSLNPDAAFFVGLKVGRRSSDLLLLDLSGRVRNTVHMPYHFPTPAEFLRFAVKGLEKLQKTIAPELRSRIAGLGIAAPFDLWKWQEEMGAEHDVMVAWQNFDLMAEVAKICAWPVYPCNDATAACAAELLLGNGQRHRDFAYFYIGYFAGGGLVLNGQLHQGPTGNAAAYGSLPVPRPSGGSEQLIREASLYLLEKELRSDGVTPDFMWQDGNDWSDGRPQIERWLRGAAKGLAIAAAAVAAVVECKAIVIDGAMPGGIRNQLVEAVRAQLARINLDGISPFVVKEGSIGVDARALGAASLPLFAKFMTDRDVLFKETI